jgi:hypothetical protein
VNVKRTSAYLCAQLRESAPYLRDAGWRQTAELLTAAADEIDALRVQVEALRSAGDRPDQVVINRRRRPSR